MTINEAIEALRGSEASTRFSALLAICTEFFGQSRIKGSHHIFKTPWAGDPRINLQTEKGRAKSYQVRQVIAALEKLSKS